MYPQTMITSIRAARAQVDQLIPHLKHGSGERMCLAEARASLIEAEDRISKSLKTESGNKEMEKEKNP